MLDGEPGRRDSSAVQARLAHHLADDPDGLLLDQRQLIALGHDLPPFIDLLVNVDLDRADVGAACIQRGSEREIAIFADIESGIDDDPDRTRVSRAITQPSASAVDRAGIHAGAAADAFERIPEIRHAKPLRAAIIDQDDM